MHQQKALKREIKAKRQKHLEIEESADEMERNSDRSNTDVARPNPLELPKKKKKVHLTKT